MTFRSSIFRLAGVRGVHFLCVLLVAITLVGPGCSKSTKPTLDTDPDPLPGRLADTLQILDESISPGDTVDVIVYLANSEQLGGYSFRFSYDTSLFDIVTKIAGSAVLDAKQLRGDFSIFNLQTPEPGIAAGVLAFSNPSGLPTGAGNTIQLRFGAKPYASPGKLSFFEFIDAPFDTNSANWFVPFNGLSQYRPVRTPGKIMIVAKS